VDNDLERNARVLLFGGVVGSISKVFVRRNREKTLRRSNAPYGDWQSLWAFVLHWRVVLPLPMLALGPPYVEQARART